MHTAQSHVWQPHSYKTIYSCGMLPVSVVHTISLMLVGEMLVKCLFLALLTQYLYSPGELHAGRKEDKEPDHSNAAVTDLRV